MMKLTNILLFILLSTYSCNINSLDTSKKAVDWVNPFICTQGDKGQLYPGAAYPFGLVKLSPDTNGEKHAGYDYDEKEIHGFSHLRIGGTGCSGAGGNILMKPGIGGFCKDKNDYKEPYIKAAEKASPGYYAVEFQSGIKVELTVTPRVGFHQYKFPSSDSAFVLIDLSRSYAGMLDASLEVKNFNEISGMVKSKNVCGFGYFKLYYAIKFVKKFDSFKTWKDANVENDVEKRTGTDIGVWVRFKTSQDEIVHAKVGISPVSMEQAKYERDNEIPGWDFETVKRNSREAWQNLLGKVQIPNGRKDLTTLFYTHLYHSYLIPNLASSSTGLYRPAGDENRLLNTNDTAPDFDFYSTWSLWDDFRKYTLISLLEPEIMQNIVRSIVDYYKTRKGYITFAEGYWPVPSCRQEFACAVILDAYQKGLDKFDFKAAYKGMKMDVDFFDDSDIGKQLEKAYQAYLVMKMAKHLGNEKDYQNYRTRALAYKDWWNPTQKDNQGNLRGFFTPNGAPVHDVDSLDTYAYEGNLWHYRWFVFHDMKGLINLRGNRDALADDLEYFFDQHIYMHLNEPDMHAPFLFNYLGKPYLTQKWARAFTTKVVTQKYHNHGFFKQPIVKRIYRDDPEGYIETMDDDTGAMSSWFVLSAMGLFPGTPGDPHYLIGSPIFPEIRLYLQDEKVFTIKANNVSEDNYYIQSARLNGQAYSKPWIEYSTIVTGGTLELEMGSTPNTAWGADPGNAPPSLSE